MARIGGRFRGYVGLVALAPPLLLSVVMQAEDWPQFRGPNRDGVWNETGIMVSFPPDGLKIPWRVRVGRGLSSPVVAQGRVFLTDVQLQKPSARERVLCFDEVNGSHLTFLSLRCAAQLAD